ncbi:PTS transporter subunit IIC [Acutalibacter caecimuris]|uniref:PTS transporter subunit IIC n=1 Tax=Acutalibacter caecimuris TaxID=3093657 RepID=UPI002AC93E43|nr:PTS sugar transporter subunit IIC [Acutalibacter sp. M00118]
MSYSSNSSNASNASNSSKKPAGPTGPQPAKKGLKAYLQLYLVDAMSAMAQGLFASLLVGTIVSTLGTQLGVPVLTEVGNFAKGMAGPAMAIAIGYALKAPPLVLFSLTAVGSAANSLGGSGGPLAVLLIAIAAAELGKLVSKKTPVDILATPLVTIGAGAALAYLIAPAVGSVATAFGQLIKDATVLQPFWMGMVVSVLVGIALTLPISSAALCAAFGLTGLAGGAAVAGCCAQMVGFAAISFRENRWGGLVAQGLGTSMLQVPNIVKNPRIWIAPTLAAAITGPIATCLFGLEMNDPSGGVASGMGTCGLVGQIGVYSGWVNDVATGAKAAITAFDWAGLLLVCFVLPALLALAFDLLFRRLGWVKPGDMALD